MAVDLQAELERCPLCDFNFMAPPSRSGGGGFGKKASLKESREYVTWGYETAGTSMPLPAPQHCPACWFALMAERAAILLSKSIIGVGATK